METARIIEALEAIAPLRYAEDWDNVGLLIGRRAGERSRVLLTIDLTPPVVDEAIGQRATMIVAYHPVIFEAVKEISDRTVRGAMLLRLAEAGIAVYCPHTALDAVTGGVNDWLCDAFSDTNANGGGDRRALMPHAELPRTQQCKIVTFVPEADLDRVRSALATIGAGIIGAYDQCSFALEGEGTFQGGEDSNPVVGEKGHLERVAEHRLEMVLSRSSVPLAVETIRRFHPYEEPAIDVYALEARPDRSQGSGRRLVLDQSMTFDRVLARLAEHLGVERLKYNDVSGGRPVRTIGLCPGAGGSLVDAAIGQGCDVFITGEMSHHGVLAAGLRGCSVILGGHTNTERGFLPRYADMIRARCPELVVHVSRADRTALELT
jgi:dinuclear metal center YbgI/SA1388 family protein